MSDRPRRLAILHSRSTPRGARHHMISQIEIHLNALGVETVHLYGTRHYEPADAIFVHVDLSVVPDQVRRFAARYPMQINAGARDIRKTSFADGLLDSWNTYDAPVIVKSDLNYGGVPEFFERGLLDRLARKIGRVLTGKPAPKIASKSDYRVFSTLAAVPPELFGEGNVVQKLLLEKDGDKNLLREYIFLGRLHYENIERSSSEIITEDDHVSCEPFVPHPRLLNLRHRMKLDYGKIDYVMIDGEPFIFDANKTMGLGSKAGTEAFGDGFNRMLKAFAEEIASSMEAPASGRLTLNPGRHASTGRPETSTQYPEDDWQTATR